VPDASVLFRQLLPEPAQADAPALLEQMFAALPARERRPYTLVNFISSADGRAGFGRHSGPLADSGDRAFFHGLREHVDAVLVGTGTLAVERYGRLLNDEGRRRRRVARGMPEQPLLCTISRSGRVPLSAPLFTLPEMRVLVFSPAAVELAGVRAEVEVVRLPKAELEPAAVMARLRSDHGVRTLLCEGGPTLFGALLSSPAPLVDELFLTLAPKLTGGGSEPTLTTGPGLPKLLPLRIRWLLERDGALYLRYALGPAGASA
jgi:riboflavin biosynthesis pyrimidine reductase